MTKLAWHQPGSRRFEAGCDRGVLYPHVGDGVPWNGLAEVSENFASVVLSPQYFDGIKFNETRSPSEFSASLRALTYPDEFMQYDGALEFAEGVRIHDQPVLNRFGMSWRTRLGNEIQSTDLGYKIHLGYNLTAIPDPRAYPSLGGASAATEFVWTLSGVPVKVSNFRPSCHFTIDSTEIHPELLNVIETILYGSELTEARLPTPSELSALIGGWDLITVTDNGDGTFTVSGPDEYVTELDPTTFRIDSPTLVYLNTTTFTVSSG